MLSCLHSSLYSVSSADECLDTVTNVVVSSADECLDDSD